MKMRVRADFADLPDPKRFNKSPDMFKMAGQTIEVREVTDIGLWGTYYYGGPINNPHWMWDTRWLEPAEPAPIEYNHNLVETL